MKTKTSYTPGPWKVESYLEIRNNGDKWWAYKLNGNIPGGWVGDAKELEEIEEAEANRRLVENAPYLLEALRSCHTGVAHINKRDCLTCKLIAETEGK